MHNEFLQADNRLFGFVASKKYKLLNKYPKNIQFELTIGIDGIRSRQ